VFCIGGPFGHAQSVIDRADDVIRLSSCVLNHQVRAEGQSQLEILRKQLVDWDMLQFNLQHVTCRSPTSCCWSSCTADTISYKDRSITIEGVNIRSQGEEQRVHVTIYVYNHPASSRSKPMRYEARYVPVAAQESRNTSPYCTHTHTQRLHAHTVQTGAPAPPAELLDT